MDDHVYQVRLPDLRWQEPAGVEEVCDWAAYWTSEPPAHLPHLIGAGGGRWWVTLSEDAHLLMAGRDYWFLDDGRAGWVVCTQDGGAACLLKLTWGGA